MEIEDIVDTQAVLEPTDITEVLELKPREDSSPEQRADVIKEVYRQAPVATKCDLRQVMYRVFDPSDITNGGLRGFIDRLEANEDVSCPWQHIEHACEACGLEVASNEEIQASFGVTQNEDGQWVGRKLCRSCQLLEAYLDVMKVPMRSEVERLFEGTDLDIERAIEAAQPNFDKSKSCPKCKRTADSPEEIRSMFGLRKMSRGERRAQSYCHKCRSRPGWHEEDDDE
ncbi:MAG: hypothetical protein ABEN55_21015 [Bradymonadaceae bacterium]